MQTLQRTGMSKSEHRAPETGQQRGPNGRFVRGNSVARTHGLTGRTRPHGPRETEPGVEAFVATALANDGGAHIPFRRKSLIQYRALLDRRIRQLNEALDMRGLVKRGGGLRDTWLQVLARCMDLAAKLDQVLGLPPPAPSGAPCTYTHDELERRVQAMTRYAEELKAQYEQEGRAAATPAHHDATGAFTGGDRLVATTTQPPSEVETVVTTLIADEGGPRPGIRRKSLLEYRGSQHSLIFELDRALEVQGIFDQRGRLRTAWLHWLVNSIAQAIRFDQVLGVPPPAKELDWKDLTPDELDQKVAASHRWLAQVKLGPDPYEWTG